VATGLDLRGERVVVLGLGTSGRAAARVLAEEGAAVLVSEARPREALGDLAELEALGVRVEAGGHEPWHLEGASLVVASPGVPEGARILGLARGRGVPIWSELELGARLARAPYLGITGTNGKTTTTEMVAACLRAAGLEARACGNIGHPFSLAAREGAGTPVVEASSFQLRFAHTFAPRVSVLLNLAPDHLDWHGTFEAYAEAKARVFANQSGDDVHVGNRDDPAAAALSRRARCRVVWTTLDEPAEGEVGYLRGELVARLDAERRLGRPAGGPALRADAAAAAAAALAFGVPAGAVAEALARFRPLPHRGEVVAEVGGVRFVDDSKATNPHAALAALEGLAGVALIAGGLAKGVDLSPLARATPRLAGVVAIGEAASELVAIFEGAVPVRKAGTMEEAVRAAHELAPPGGVVLLAPACASQDMFRDYVERGERFRAAAAALAAEVG
jgi:UDP-N-acetylmuramoylalanine--D-glutamate ligase